MLFGEKNCTKCGSSYDVARDTCPTCNTPNKKRRSLRHILFVSPLKQLLFIFVGFVGLRIFASIYCNLFLDKLFSENEVIYHTITNWVCYSFLLLGLFAITLKDFKLFKRHFTKPLPYIIGFFCGIGLLILSTTYNNIAYLIYPHEVNANQTIANSMMSQFPLSSIIVIGIMGPICEEFTYRLGVYSFLRRINKFLAYAVTIIFFALIHIDFSFADVAAELISIPSYIMAGFVFCLIYEKFGLAGSMTAHITNNLVIVLLSILIRR